jgi:Zn-finger protein
MSEPKPVWVGKDFQEPIRGQEADWQNPSDGSKRCKARSVTFYSCGKCGVGLKMRDDNGVVIWPKDCVHCHWLNYLPF